VIVIVATDRRVVTLSFLCCGHVRRGFAKPPPPLPQATCRFFASGTTLKPHPEAVKITAYFPDIAASLLRDANCSLPLFFSCTINDRCSVSLLGADLHTPASA